MILSALVARTREHSEVHQVQGSPIPGIVQAVFGNLGQVGSFLVPGDDVLDDKGVPLRTVMVAMELVDRVGESPVLPGQSEVRLVALPFETLHGWVGPAVFISAVDQVPGNDHPEQIVRHFPSTQGSGDLLAGQGTGQHGHHAHRQASDHDA